MNKRGVSALLGFSLLVLLFLFVITIFTTVEPLKETLNTIRGGDNLNCRGVSDFNQTKYDADNSSEINKLTRRPTCFVTGVSMIWWVLAFVVAAFAWVGRNWRNLRK